MAGLVTAGSSASGALGGTPTQAPLALRSAAAVVEPEVTGTVGMLAGSGAPLPKVRAANVLPPEPFTGAVPLQNIAIPSGLAGLGIPEIVLAAYRNAELAMQTAQPGCGVSWNLLAGIGRIESGHAGGGRTDPAGTTLTPVLGPVLDGRLPGNEIIKVADAGPGGAPVFARAIGPMQFLPGTWKIYGTDGNADGTADPNNVFDAAMGAAKYLCSGGLNLREPAQEMRAILRYNNSVSYATNVLSWSAAYRTGGTPSSVPIPTDILIAPGTSISTEELATQAAKTTVPAPPTTAAKAPDPTTVAAPPPPPMIIIPGLPPIPCGIFCPPPAAPPPAPAPAGQQPPAPAAERSESHSPGAAAPAAPAPAPASPTAAPPPPAPAAAPPPFALIPPLVPPPPR